MATSARRKPTGAPWAFVRFGQTARLTSAILLAPLLEQEDALLVGDHNVEQLVAIEVIDNELCANTRVVINGVREEGDDAVGRLLGLEPVEHRGHVGTLLALSAVRPVTLAGHQVLDAVAIDVNAVHRMRLGDELREEIDLHERVAFLPEAPDSELVRR